MTLCCLPFLVLVVSFVNHSNNYITRHVFNLLYINTTNNILFTFSRRLLRSWALWPLWRLHCAQWTMYNKRRAVLSAPHPLKFIKRPPRQLPRRRAVRCSSLQLKRCAVPWGGARASRCWVPQAVLSLWLAPPSSCHRKRCACPRMVFCPIMRRQHRLLWTTTLCRCRPTTGLLARSQWRPTEIYQTLWTWRLLDKG